MSTTQKVLLWSAVIVVALVGGLVVGGRIWWKSPEAGLQAEMTNGRTFGRGTPARRCVEQVLDRHATGTGLTASIAQSLYLNGCLETADSVAAFCQTNSDMSVTGRARWTLSLCQGRGLKDQLCSTALQPLVQRCSRPDMQRRAS